FFQAEDGIRDRNVTGVQTCALPISSATLIPSIALPISIVGTFSVMYILDYSLDNLSMMALILSVGFVVDDAIVMLENIVRHLERSEERRVGKECRWRWRGEVRKRER